MAAVNYLKYLEEADQARAREIYEKVKDAPPSDWYLNLKVNTAGEHLHRMTALAFKELERFGRNYKFYTGQGPEARNCAPLSTTISVYNKKTAQPDTPFGELVTIAMSLKVSTVPGFEPDELNDAEWLVTLWAQTLSKTLDLHLEDDLLYALRKLFKACRLHAKNLRMGVSKDIMEESCDFLRVGARRLMDSADSLRTDIERMEEVARSLQPA